MGFLIHAGRKLILRQEINRGEYDLMNVTRELQKTQDKMSNIQQQQSMFQDIWNAASGQSSALTSAMSNLFNNTVGESQAVYTQAKAEYDRLAAPNSGATQEQISKAKAAMEEAQSKATSSKNAVKDQIATLQSAMMRQAQSSHMMNSIFGQADNFMYQHLYLKGQRLAQRKDSLESQLALKQAEIQSVEKAEAQTAKDSAPKFGLS